MNNPSAPRDLRQVVAQAVDHGLEAAVHDLVAEVIKEVLKNDALGSQLKHSIRGEILRRLQSYGG